MERRVVKFHIDIKANHFKIALSQVYDQQEKHQKVVAEAEKNKNTSNLRPLWKVV